MYQLTNMLTHCTYSLQTQFNYCLHTGLLNTYINTLTHERMVIPNSQVHGNRITNLSQLVAVRVSAYITTCRDADVDNVRDILQEAMVYVNTWVQDTLVLQYLADEDQKANEVKLEEENRLKKKMDSWTGQLQMYIEDLFALIGISFGGRISDGFNKAEWFLSQDRGVTGKGRPLTMLPDPVVCEHKHAHF